MINQIMDSKGISDRVFSLSLSEDSWVLWLEGWHRIDRTMLLLLDKVILGIVISAWEEVFLYKKLK